ncbi:hypothetical protein AAD001_13930 [Colwelliaceae bacterium 6471]
MKQFCTWVFFILASSVAFAEEQIVWLTDNKDDISFLKTNNFHSIGTDTVNLVLNQLKGFELTLKVASVSRMDEQLKSTTNTCVSNRIKTPSRAELNEFSLPVNMHPSPKLYFYADAVRLPESVIENGALTSLSRLMEYNPDKKIALVENVSYGEEIDRQLQSLDDKYLTFLNVDNRFDATFKLFFQRLVDFTIDYPSEMKVQLAKHSNTEKLSSIGFSTSKGYVLSHIACSKSATGAAFIAAVNNALINLYSTEHLLAAHLRYIDKSSTLSFTKDFKQVFKPIEISNTVITANK